MGALHHVDRWSFLRRRLYNIISALNHRNDLSINMGKTNDKGK